MKRKREKRIFHVKPFFNKEKKEKIISWITHNKIKKNCIIWNIWQEKKCLPFWFEKDTYKYIQVVTCAKWKRTTMPSDICSIKPYNLCYWQMWREIFQHQNKNNSRSCRQHRSRNKNHKKQWPRHLNHTQRSISIGFNWAPISIQILLRDLRRKFGEKQKKIHSYQSVSSRENC